MSQPDLSSTPRTALGRHRERGKTERDDLYAVLDAGLVCHLGVIVNGVPRVLPTGYGRLGDLLYLHGSSANSSTSRTQPVKVSAMSEGTPRMRAMTRTGICCA